MIKSNLLAKFQLCFKTNKELNKKINEQRNHINSEITNIKWFPFQNIPFRQV